MNEPQLSRDVRRRLAMIKHAEEVTGNVAMTCRYYGISRTAYYRHFDGTTWTSVPRPANDLGGWPQVYDLAQVGRTASVWGVGPGAGDRLLIDRFR